MKEAAARIHRMPFGAETLGEAGTRFRLWAPAARTVELCLERGGGGQVLPMPATGDGWHELLTGEAAGCRYRYRIDAGIEVPDPASRFQPQDVHGASEVVDPRAFSWKDGDWRGRPWEEAVIYELHVGSFTPEGTYAGVRGRLGHLQNLGATAIELMPIADFPGARNWGYDGVLPFAPESRYGRPEALKELVQAAHAAGLMMFLDVVYNHFGPEGNYLQRYAPDFFTERHHTPWGAAINFDGPGSRTVRDYFIHNALYWLEEYRFDGLRLDAVHAILDDSTPHILAELAAAVRAGPGRDRQIHLVLENDANQARYLGAGGYAAQWNDDLHHALHALITGEKGSYYADYSGEPARHLGRCLAEGFAYQGERSAHRGGRPRGESSAALAPIAFVGFLQNHDQVGNRAMGDRIARIAPPEAVAAATAILLLAPSPPLLFMGEEWGCEQPFPFFCDFGGELARRVTEGRRREFAAFSEFSDPAALARIPDPNAGETFARAVLRWEEILDGNHGRWLEFHRELLALRRREIVPRLSGTLGGRARRRSLGERALWVEWPMGDASRVTLTANLGSVPVAAALERGGRLIHSTPASAAAEASAGTLAPWSVLWQVREGPPA
ncbi:MAG: malto-oligosyltrehalose trehalohydrolase [Burkholderiales bacterium]